MFQLLRYVWDHPLCRGHRRSALRRVFSWQIASRLIRGPIAVPFTKRSWLLMERGMSGATGNYYCGLHEFDDMAFVVNLLRPGDLFVDVGTNVGSYTVLASGHVGATTIAVEPVPATFERLRANIRYNEIEKLVTPMKCGVGDRESELRFTATLDTVNHVATEKDSASETLKIPVTRLDTLLAESRPMCIKIDVEGFELRVIEGANKVLRADSLRAVLMELNGSGERYGFTDEQVHAAMVELGFAPFRYGALAGKLERLAGPNPASGNTLYLRDLAFVSQRLSGAPAIELPWRTVSCPPVTMPAGDPPPGRDAR